MYAKLFLMGFPHYWSEQKLGRFVSAYGSIVAAKIVRAPSGPLALVEMKTLEEAHNAARGLDGMRLDEELLAVIQGESALGHEVENIFLRLTGHRKAS
ncbi:MAG: hypothetical protein C4293_04760 [Nitrospiraceae bacterium]